MNVKVEKQPKSTIKLTVTVPNDKVKESYDKVLEQAVKNTEIEGFRKGNAPKNMVEEKIGVSHLHGDVINKLLQTYYPQALKENKIAPISNPRVEIQEFDINKDFEFTATVALRPDVKIGDYKKAIKKLQKEKNEELKKANAEKIKNGEEIAADHVHLTANEIVNILIDEAKVEIPEILVDEETDRMMARLVDQAQTIGMSLDQYLKAQNKTSDELRKEYDKISERNIIAELVMGHLIRETNIEVEESEIQEMIKASGVDDIQTQDPMQMFYVKSILQKNKLITNLMEEAENE